jgi:hypothetical protein
VLAHASPNRAASILFKSSVDSVHFLVNSEASEGWLTKTQAARLTTLASEL